ncbi:type II secretion system minor pseudopilin GspK [Pseudomonas sp. LD120]|uniref:type II secretion system minor pseudopilin GspK n=1 Tax=Pseudomonas sp. LD120 TaxID=485751 RepID=UPI00135A031C|nr:type II secretion system minor pseudopilin GspK [Pseudomonas sp. LD120]KAF0865948.1 type II secretion system minor pseudopilin GspK [Pseudomonas sp. LD120]
MASPLQQRGVALLSVLLITALVTLLVSNMLARQRLNLHSSSHLAQQQQLWQLALSGESWARQQLLEDVRSEGGLLVTHLGQHWAQPAPVFEIDGGRIHIQLEDLSARLNLNSLRQGNDLNLRARYQRLLAQQGIKAHDPALLISQSNRDGVPLPLGDLSELRQLPQVDSQVLEQLAPLVDAFDNSAINVNTTHADVLASIEGIDQITARTLVNSRPAKGYHDVAAFLSNPMLQGRDISPLGLGVSSRQFRATIDVEQGQRRLRLVSQLQVIDAKQVRVQQRTLRPSPPPDQPKTE